MHSGLKVAAVLSALLLAGCSSEATATEAGEQFFNDFQAAEAAGWDVDMLQSLADGLPKSATVTGIADDDGDGLDDDGQVSVTEDGDWACVILPGKARDGNVSSGACS
ncbi:hypothetical protein [Nocardioides bruguierae]|uniref:Lipoprotein n=1 Tax=Nocardioides bruguierae TaxID=2945102 RepID=A0A9X2DBB6_9ACTN|nr:hypothetical protein [Nocardioides bruguierae]MCM0622811.1 hypothetical protein [Nocardioides bruguierae]